LDKFDKVGDEVADKVSESNSAKKEDWRGAEFIPQGDGKTGSA
jgi:hypothetical protein